MPKKKWNLGMPNAQPGVPFDSTVEAYKHIYEDFYKKPLDKESLTKLDEYAKTMVERTLKKDGGKRFSIKQKKVH